jgi:hypothetical protein
MTHDTGFFFLFLLLLFLAVLILLISKKYIIAVGSFEGGHFSQDTGVLIQVWKPAKITATIIGHLPHP